MNPTNNIQVRLQLATSIAGLHSILNKYTECIYYLNDEHEIQIIIRNIYNELKELHNEFYQLNSFFQNKMPENSFLSEQRRLAYFEYTKFLMEILDKFRCELVNTATII